MERNSVQVSLTFFFKVSKSMNQVDGTVAVVDPRLGEFKEQFMLPVGSVIPKYVVLTFKYLSQFLDGSKAKCA